MNSSGNIGKKDTHGGLLGVPRTIILGQGFYEKHVCRCKKDMPAKPITIRAISLRRIISHLNIFEKLNFEFSRPSELYHLNG